MAMPNLNELAFTKQATFCCWCGQPTGRPAIYTFCGEACGTAYRLWHYAGSPVNTADDHWRREVQRRGRRANWSI